MSKIIKNNVDLDNQVSTEEFLSWEFNKLKDDVGRDVSGLIESIKDFGFAVPVFIWEGKNEKTYVLDGTGRSLAVKQLLADGYSFDGIPYVKIEADTKKRAMELVPSIASSFGEVTRDSFIQFADGLNLNFDKIKIEGISSTVLANEPFNYQNKNKEISMGGPSHGKSGNGSGGNYNDDGFKTCPQCGYELSADDDEEI